MNSSFTPPRWTAARTAQPKERSVKHQCRQVGDILCFPAEFMAPAKPTDNSPQDHLSVKRKQWHRTDHWLFRGDLTQSGLLVRISHSTGDLGFSRMDSLAAGLVCAREHRLRRNMVGLLGIWVYFVVLYCTVDGELHVALGEDTLTVDRLVTWGHSRIRIISDLNAFRIHPIITDCLSASNIEYSHK